MSFLDGLLKDGVSALGTSIGGMAKDIRTAITGKESITSEERQKILDAASRLEELALAADQAINESQTKINEIEANSTSGFRGNWRPSVGWVCVSGLAYQFIIVPIFPWVANILSHLLYIFLPKVEILSHHVPAMPSLDMGTLMTLLTGMLGLGSMRTFEKIKGLN